VIAQFEGGKRSAQDRHPNCEHADASKRAKRGTLDANVGNGAWGRMGQDGADA
jgi:hypothetical protein